MDPLSNFEHAFLEVWLSGCFLAQLGTVWDDLGSIEGASGRIRYLIYDCMAKWLYSRAGLLRPPPHFKGWVSPL